MRRALEPGRNRGARGGIRSASPCDRLACRPRVAVDEPGVFNPVGDGRAARAGMREVVARQHVLGVAEKRHLSKCRGAHEPLDAVCGPGPVDRPQELLPRRRCGCDRNAARRKHRGECKPAQHDAEHELPTTTLGSTAKHDHHPQSWKTPTPRRRREGQHHADPPHRPPAANLEPGRRTRPSETGTLSSAAAPVIPQKRDVRGLHGQFPVPIGAGRAGWGMVADVAGYPCGWRRAAVPCLREVGWPRGGARS